MNQLQAGTALQAVGAVAALGLFLPSIDHAWNDDPLDPEVLYRHRRGETVYLGSAAAITLLAAYASGSAAPFIIGFGIALTVVGMQEHALRRWQGQDAGA